MIFTGWWYTYPSGKMMEFVTWDDDSIPNWMESHQNSMVPVVPVTTNQWYVPPSVGSCSWLVSSWSSSAFFSNSPSWHRHGAKTAMMTGMISGWLGPSIWCHTKYVYIIQYIYYVYIYVYTHIYIYDIYIYTIYIYMYIYINIYLSLSLLLYII